LIRVYKKKDDWLINFDYEEFFQFLKDLQKVKSLSFLQRIIYRIGLEAEANPNFHFEKDTFMDHVKGGSLMSDVINCFQYRVKHLLTEPLRESNPEFIKSSYSKFIGYLKRYDKVEVFTLNHDLLHEHIFDEFSIDYDDGYDFDSQMYVELVGAEKPNKKIPLFDFQTGVNSRDKGVYLYKLHGSIDSYLSSYPNKGVNISDKYKYIENGVPLICVKADSADPLQNLRFDGHPLDLNNTQPQFITGVRKNEFIEQNPLTKSAYCNLERSLAECDELLVIGASLQNDSSLMETLKKSQNKQVKGKYICKGNDFLLDYPNVELIKSINDLARDN